MCRRKRQSPSMPEAGGWGPPMSTPADRRPFSSCRSEVYQKSWSNVSDRQQETAGTISKFTIWAFNLWFLRVFCKNQLLIRKIRILSFSSCYKSSLEFSPLILLSSSWKRSHAMKSSCQLSNSAKSSMVLYSIICQYPCFLPPIRFSKPSSWRRDRLWMIPPIVASGIFSHNSFRVALGCSFR